MRSTYRFKPAPVEPTADSIYDYCTAVDLRLEGNGFQSFTVLEEEKAQHEIAFMQAAFLSNIDPGECAFYVAMGRG